MSRLDETLKQDRRRFLRAALGGGTLLAVGGGWLAPRLFAASSVPVGKPGKVSLEIFADDGRDLGPRQVPKLVL
ncbi:MAG: peptide-methionine (R)-S-oxide reductase, partial [Xanthomonadaceae bacterium]|nr:peptide-methionine (R)-S-oxide reductase [Xanthomonadaceae bacterium]